jgi:CRP-like cAMP-binding protein
MATDTKQPAVEQEPEDPLSHLPCSTISEYRKGQIIYGPDRPSAALYLLIDGKVKVQRMKGKKVVLLVDIYLPDDLFGESSFIGFSDTHEMAIALEKTRVMTWTRNAVEELMPKRPRLSIALIQLLTLRCLNLSRRIESCASENLEQRLARTLIQFSERFGRKADDGSTQMMPLAHESIAQYLGTSRELVTHLMTQFRSRGYVQYSRLGIVLKPEQFRSWLKDSIKTASDSGTVLEHPVV